MCRHPACQTFTGVIVNATFRILLTSILFICACSDGNFTVSLARPTAEIASPAEGNTFVEGDVVTLTGVVQLSAGSRRGNLTASWLSSLDGPLGSQVLSEGQTTYQISTNTLSVGAHQLTFSASFTDTTDSATVGITVSENHPPVVAITQPLPFSEHVEGDLVPLEVLVTDQESAPEILGVSWFSSLSGIIASDLIPGSNGVALTGVPLLLGQHVLTATAMDPQGKSSSAQVTVDVLLPNDSPTCAIVEPLPDDAFELGTYLTVRAVVEDPDGDNTDLDVYLSSDIGPLGVDAPLANGDVTFWNVFLPSGTHSLVIETEDARGGSCVDAITVRISTPPTVEIMAPADGDTVTSGIPLTFSANVEDGEDSAPLLGIQWKNETTGNVLSTTPASAIGVTTFTTSSLPPGANTISLTVTDTSGLATTDVMGLTVNLPPIVSLTLPSAGPVVTLGSPVLFHTNVADPEDAPSQLYVDLSSSLSGSMASGFATAGGIFDYVAMNLQAGSHIVTATVTDTDGAQTTATVNITVNTPPTVVISAPLPNEVFPEGSLVLFEATVVDPEDATSGLISSMPVVWMSSLDGVISTSSPLSSGLLAFTSTTLTNAVHAVVVTVTDSMGAVGTDSVTFALNEAPTVPEISLVPSNPNTLDNLVVSITTTSMDPEGGTVLYGYEWTKDGVPQSYGATVPASATAHFEVWQVAVTATDNAGNTTPSLSASVMIENTPPSGSTPFLTPEEAYEETILSCDGALADPDTDGDTVTVTYLWEVNGVPVPSATGPALDGADFNKNDDVICAAVYDDVYDATTVSATEGLTIQNTLPTEPTIGITPSAPNNADDLTCVVTAAALDLDGDVLSYTYAWYVNGTLTLWNTSTLSGSETTPGETWECKARAFDGDGFGAWSTISPSVFVQCIWANPGGHFFDVCSGALGCDVWDYTVQDGIGVGFADAANGSCAMGSFLYSTCLEFDFGSVVSNRLVRVVARSSASSPVCGDTCSGSCTTQSDYHIFKSANSNVSTFVYLGSHTVDQNWNDTIISIPGLFQYVRFCRGADTAGANNLELDLFKVCN